jgi:hypothetical protein
MYSLGNPANGGHQTNQVVLTDRSTWTARGVACYVLSYAFVALELALMYYAVNVAWSCSRTMGERVVHIALAVGFTMPYMLCSLFWGDCAKGSLAATRPLPGPLARL